MGMSCPCTPFSSSSSSPLLPLLSLLVPSDGGVRSASLTASASITLPSGRYAVPAALHDSQMRSLLSAAHSASHSCRGKYEDGQSG